jgi:FkbM family methyltransferase
MAQLRRVSGTWPLRPLLKLPRVERVVAVALRSAVVRERLGFVARELPRRRVLARYTLRESGLTAYVRHGTGDVVTLDEVFLTRDYAMPREVEATLADVGAPRVADLGANVGYVGLAVLARWPAARIVGFEPDAANAAVLERTISANGAGDHWRVLRAAAGVRPGSAAFLTGRVALSRLLAAAGPAETQSAQSAVVQVPVVDAFEHLREADLIKLDIEGGEWMILGDPRLAALPAKALVLEYHPELCPEPDPHSAARRRLQAAGFALTTIWRRDDGHGMLWAYRPR